MPILTRVLLVSVILVSVSPGQATAGMASVTLADIPRAVRTLSQTGLTGLARKRIEVISFFLLGLMACAKVVQWVWNGLRKEFPILPRLSFARALGVIILWGLLFVLILTMISGARELMTPGAWEKKGLTYRLVPPPPIEAEIRARVDALDNLGTRLRSYAQEHQGAYPSIKDAKTIGESIWHVPQPHGGLYLYVGGILPASEDFPSTSPLAYEPESVGPDRLVLMTDGIVQWLPVSEIDRRLESRKP